MALKVKPLGDRVLVEAVEEQEVKQGGIIIPDPLRKNHPKPKLLLWAPANQATTAAKLPSK